MSFETLRYLYCDGLDCSNLFDDTPPLDEPIDEQRRRALRYGWHRADRKDWCAECWGIRIGKPLPPPTPDPKRPMWSGT